MSNISILGTKYKILFKNENDEIRLKDKFGKDYPKKINIIGMYKDGILLEKFYGTGEIKRKYNYVPVAILDCCKGKYKKMYGYEWRFINE